MLSLHQDITGTLDKHAVTRTHTHTHSHSSVHMAEHGPGPRWCAQQQVAATFYSVFLFLSGLWQPQKVRSIQELTVMETIRI